MLNQVTVVIPAHNRPERLRRLLDYYSGTNISILVSDSSDKEFGYASHYPQAVHRHYPRELLFRKIINILPLIDTPYVFYCADDDFIVPQAVEQMMLFLEANPDYATALGHYLTFEVKRNKIEFTPRYIRHFDKRIEAGSAAGRLDRYKNIYATNLYSVIRSDVFKKMYLACAKPDGARFSNLFLGEEYFNLFSLIHGNCATLPVFYSARERIPNSATSTTVPFDIVKSSESHKEEYSAFVDILATELARKDGIPYEAAEALVIRAIDMPKTGASLAFKRKVLGWVESFRYTRWIGELMNMRYKRKGMKAVKGMPSYPCKEATPEIDLIKESIYKYL